MKPAIQDTIEREITVKAPPERVYNLIADPKQITTWFPNAVEGDMAVGDKPIFNFGEHGKTQVYIEAARPHEYFAYRWVPGSEHFVGDVRQVPHTLVEFFLEQDGDGTKVRLLESGFQSLPAEVVEQKFKQNTAGWEFMLGRLEAHLAAS